MTQPDSYNNISVGVNVIRAGKSVGSWINEMDWEDSPSVAGGFPLSRSDSYVHSIDVISNMSSLSLGSKRRMEDSDIEVSGKKVKLLEETMEEKTLAKGGMKFRIPIVISWFNRDKVFCSKTIDALIDTGAEITIVNARMVQDDMMPWRHRESPLRIMDASNNRMQKSGKVIVTSVELKVVDARSKKQRTFKPRLEVADLGPDEQLILGNDWLNQTTDKIVVNPPGLEFKSLIDIDILDNETED
jgi:hypothetical protein